jgi:hypothetical protein
LAVSPSDSFLPGGVLPDSEDPSLAEVVVSVDVVVAVEAVVDGGVEDEDELLLLVLLLPQPATSTRAAPAINVDIHVRAKRDRIILIPPKGSLRLHERRRLSRSAYRTRRGTNL